MAHPCMTLRAGVVVVSLGVWLAGAPAPAHAQGLPAVQPTAQPAAAGGERWKGEATLPGLKLAFLVTLEQDAATGAWSGKLDIPMQGVQGMAVTDVALTDEKLSFLFAPQGAPYPARFDLKRVGDSATGSIEQAGQTFPVTMSRLQPGESADVAPKRPQEPKPPFPYGRRDVEYTSKDGARIAGTLTYPTEGPGHPAVLMITGSGPQDRDETLLGHKPFLVIADHLTRHGIVVLRVDDRGVGGSSGDIMTTPLETNIDDVLAGVAFLRAQSEVDARRIGLIGHSEGGTIAPAAATRSSDVAFIVLLAGTGTRGDQVWLDQSALIARTAGVPDATVDRQHAAQQRFVRALMDNADREALRAAMRDYMAAASAPGTMDTEKGRELIDKLVDQQLAPTTSVWFRSFLGFDPREALRRVTCPVLALGGANDLQVPPKANLLGIATALRAAGNGDVTIVELPGLNHLFQPSPTGLPLEYAKIEQTFSPLALEIMTDWIRARTGLVGGE